MNISINEWEKVLLNLFVVLLFVFVNPIYALFFCAFLNLTTLRINYWIFSFMFILSFTLWFYINDYSNYTNDSDFQAYINIFKTTNDISWSQIFFRFVDSPHGNEPFFWVYVKLIRTLLTNNASVYVFFQFFTIFTLIAYLGKIINANKFVIIILCILFSNFAAIIEIAQQWRHILGFFIFFIGVIFLDRRETFHL